MSSALNFTKMHGAGNDFVMIDQRDLEGQILTPEHIMALCDRRTGVGADGLIIIASPSSASAAFRMIYSNADGYEAEMCGNGARCSVAFAQAAGLAETKMHFDTYSGLLEGTVFGPEDVEVSLPAWKDLQLNVDLGPQEFSAHHTCNTGVPHLVIPVPDVAHVDVCRWGSHYRNHELFAPSGTNVNFVSLNAESGENMLRTYERGVEDETLACGTGASATAVVLCQLGLLKSPVKIHTRGGDQLQVSVDFTRQKLLLRGPAVTSFRGKVQING